MLLLEIDLDVRKLKEIINFSSNRESQIRRFNIIVIRKNEYVKFKIYSFSVIRIRQNLNRPPLKQYFIPIKGKGF